MALKFIKCFALSVAALLFTLSCFAQVRLPAGYYWKQLPNGLQVIVIENSKVPLATVEIAVKNGSFAEDSVYNGLSHLFEHMFFKANKDYPTQEQFLNRVQQLGISFNGTTYYERVNYFFTLNSDSVNAGLRLINAAIRYPLYDKEEMKKERVVVDGEFQRNESNPFFQLYVETNKRMWGDLVTRKNPIGIHEIINTATPEKMLVIKGKYYVPNNSLLTVAGDVKHEEIFAMAEKIFGDWKSSGVDPIKQYPVPDFKPLTKSEYFVKESTIARSPYIDIEWHGPSYLTDSASTVAAQVFSTIIELNSSKLQQALVNSGLANNVGLDYQTTKYTGAISYSVVPNPNKIKECYAEMMNQLSMMDNPDYYTDEQLAIAKATLKRADEYRKEKPSSLASQLSYDWCSTSLNYATDLTDNYQKVTRADIKRYIETYIAGKPMIAGIIISPDANKTVNAASFFKAQ